MCVEESTDFRGWDASGTLTASMQNERKQNYSSDKYHDWIMRYEAKIYTGSTLFCISDSPLPGLFMRDFFLQNSAWVTRWDYTYECFSRQEYDFLILGTVSHPLIRNLAHISWKWRLKGPIIFKSAELLAKCIVKDPSSNIFWQHRSHTIDHIRLSPRGGLAIGSNLPALSQFLSL